jgi:hypothetical protein
VSQSFLAVVLASLWTPFGFILCLNNQMKELFDDGRIVA